MLVVLIWTEKHYLYFESGIQVETAEEKTRTKSKIRPEEYYLK